MKNTLIFLSFSSALPVPCLSPASVRDSADVLYLQPEPVGSPDGQWYSSTPLQTPALESLLTRVLMVRDVYLEKSEEKHKEQEDRAQQAEGEKQLLDWENDNDGVDVFFPSHPFLKLCSHVLPKRDYKITKKINSVYLSWKLHRKRGFVTHQDMFS